MSAAGMFGSTYLDRECVANSTLVFRAGVGIDFDPSLDVFPKREFISYVSLRILADGI